jgi:hypothetical protein
MMAIFRIKCNDNATSLGPKKEKPKLNCLGWLEAGIRGLVRLWFEDGWAIG